MLSVKFWGTRGSIPSCISEQEIRSKISYALNVFKSNSTMELDVFIDQLPFWVRSTYGGNTPCIEIKGGHEVIICDAGSGLRDLGNHIMRLKDTAPATFHILMSHVHWDHIQGFPFFVPAYKQGNSVSIHGFHQNLKQAFEVQQQAPFFPIQLSQMGSNIKFNFHTVSDFEIGGIAIKSFKQNHPGDSFAYCFEKDNSKIIYSTDVEFTEEEPDEIEKALRFYHQADILIIDGQFNLADHLFTKQNWGHSSNLLAIEMAVRAQVKKLVLFHSDHNLSDEKLDKFYQDSLRYLQIFDPASTMQIVLAYDGLEI